MNSPESHDCKDEDTDKLWLDASPEALALLDLIEKMELAATDRVDQ